MAENNYSMAFASTIAIIAAINKDFVIGHNNKIPWYYPGDLRRFKELTLNKTVIMGRNTFESLNCKPLKERRNIVITNSLQFDTVECYKNISSALLSCSGDVWFIGGSKIYEEAMEYASFIDLTFVPDFISITGKTVFFPEIKNWMWSPGVIRQHEYEPTLKTQIYIKTKKITF